MYVPGTSSVSLSLRIPSVDLARYEFGSLTESDSDRDDEAAPPKKRFHRTMAGLSDESGMSPFVVSGKCPAISVASLWSLPCMEES